MEHLLQKSKCSIFQNIFKYMIFQKALLWSKGFNTEPPLCWNIKVKLYSIFYHLGYVMYWLAFVDWMVRAQQKHPTDSGLYWSAGLQMPGSVLVPILASLVALLTE